MIKVRISTRAAEFIRAEKAYIARFDKRAAARLSRQLRRLSTVLSEYPKAGEAIPGTGEIRRFVTTPYIVEYEVHRTELVILIIRHGRQSPDIDPNEDADIDDAK